ncbi:uncharacterized protein LOC121749092 [Salvia splendens]|uniref:uncharacterized protein LOC121749092 n=1 Tax=Salvia splendens TaxID=180675 RepID=UPI001C276558|nr:uncharacterized protein LOC121749092 [Salvia splendens]
MHGPCGVVRKSSPCMRDGRCTKYYPKKFVDDTIVDDDGYPIDGHWQPRKQCYYVGSYMLLVLGATCYEDLRFVNGVQYDTFRDACFALGLLDDDKEYIDGILEASFWLSAHSLRLVFVSLLSSESVSRPDVLWQKCWKHLSDDVVYNQRKLRNQPGLVLGDDEIQNFVFADIEKLLLNVGKSLCNYHGIRSKGGIVLNVASSGIAFLLLPGGRTVCSRFKIPINVNEDSMCNIKQGSDLDEIIIRSKLIIWDEAPMIHKHCIEAVDRALRDILRVCIESSMNKPFGGKTIVFCGDFRQILPVVPKGSRQNVINATINSSYLWRNCTMLMLIRNMRLLSVESSVEASKLKEFSSWVASIGDGVVGGPNDGEVVIDLPSNIVLSNIGDPLKTIVENIYPSYMDPKELSNCLHDRAILAPTLDVVDEVNQFMISLDQSQGRVPLIMYRC